MKKVFLGMIMVILVFVSAVVSAENYPDSLLQQISAMKADADAKKDMPVLLEGLKNISSEDALKMLKAKKAVFLDNRIKAQFDTEKIQGAEWFLADDLMKNPAVADKLDKNKEYVLYCNGVHCWRSPAAGLMLKHLGFTRLYWLREGIPDWKKKGFPTE